MRAGAGRLTQYWAGLPANLRGILWLVVGAFLFVIVDVKKKSNNADANVPFRGVQEGAFDVRRDIRITDGRMFEPGKNEILVFADADLDEAVEGVVGSAFGHAGQKCSAASRVLVEASIADRFISRLRIGYSGKSPRSV